MPFKDKMVHLICPYRDRQRGFPSVHSPKDIEQLGYRDPSTTCMVGVLHKQRASYSLPKLPYLLSLLQLSSEWSVKGRPPSQKAPATLALNGPQRHTTKPQELSRTKMKNEDSRLNSPNGLYKASPETLLACFTPRLCSYPNAPHN